MTTEENVQAREFEALFEEAKLEGHGHKGASEHLIHQRTTIKRSISINLLSPKMAQ
jgi:hypothetical protein